MFETIRTVVELQPKYNSSMALDHLGLSGIPLSDFTIDACCFANCKEKDAEHDYISVS